MEFSSKRTKLKITTAVQRETSQVWIDFGWFCPGVGWGGVGVLGEIRKDRPAHEKLLRCVRSYIDYDDEQVL